MAAAPAVPRFRVRWQIPDDSAPAIASVLQNSGGPCPLLALANALLLRRAITIPANTQSVSEEQLLGCVCQLEPLIGHMDVLPNLGREVAVDPCFSGTTEFVPSPELAIFKTANIRLVHGAIPDPHDDVIVECISPLSYNQVCDRLVAAAVQAEEAGCASTSTGVNAAGDESTFSSVPLEPDNGKESNLVVLQHRDGEQKITRDVTAPTASVSDTRNTSNDVAETSREGDVTEGASAATVEASDDTSVDASVDADIADELGTGVWTVPPHLNPEESSNVTSSTLLSSRDTPDSGELIARNAAFVQAFLDDTACMMTFHGLTLLHETLEEGEFACLFFNNHFSVLTMNKKRLFMLVTDEGYMRAPDVVYEGLSDLDGNTTFFDAKFKPVDMSLNDSSGLISARRETESTRNRRRPFGSQTPNPSQRKRPPGSSGHRSGGSSSITSRRSEKPSKKTCSLQ